jgi:hypothetical protein
MKAALFVFVLGAVSAFGQDDAGMMAAQQAAMASQQATQQALQDMQTASQTAQQASQQAMDNNQQNSFPFFHTTRMPIFSVKEGTITSGTFVRISCRTRNAVIFYTATTKGWSPAANAQMYIDPIPIDTTTQLQAFAVAPNKANSDIANALYTVNEPSNPQPIVLSADGVLHANTRLHLVTNSTVSSETAQVGDDISIILNQDVIEGDIVVVPKGTQVSATITQADHSGRFGRSGILAFELYPMTFNGTQIPLRGGATLIGGNGGKQKARFSLPSFHGDRAEINPGMSLIASVVVDTHLKPAAPQAAIANP